MTDIYNSQTHAHTGQSNYCVCGGGDESFHRELMLGDHSYCKLNMSIPSVTHLQCKLTF
jgi:hypothetical protein